jgi:peptide/nickel transport system permease protein
MTDRVTDVPLAVVSTSQPEPRAKAESPWRLAWRRFRESRVAVVSLAIVSVIAVVAIMSPVISPQDPYDLLDIELRDSLLPPGSVGYQGDLYLLGTDEQGRDLVSAIFYGLRLSLVVSVISTAAALVIGAVLGLSAVWWGGWWDTVLMRLVDIQISLPTVLVGLVMLAVLGSGVDKVILALIIVQWAYYARLIRSSALAEREKDYVAAARCLGLPAWRIQLAEILPNCTAPVMVVIPVHLAGAITLEATLSFLGVGVPITEPSLGALISQGFPYLLSGDFWISFFPGMTLFVTIAAINLVGDQLRDALNPRLSR